MKIYTQRWDMPNYDIRIQEHIIVATMFLRNFTKAHEDNDIGQELSRWDTCERSEGSYYNEMTHVISSLDELEMKVIQNKITTSICGILPS